MHLQNLSKQMIARRVDNGTLRVDSYSLTFQLDESGSPVDCAAPDRTEANSLIEEVKKNYVISFVDHLLNVSAYD